MSVETFRFVNIGDAHFANDWRQPDRIAAVRQIVGAHLFDCALGAWGVPGDLFDGTPEESERVAWTDLLIEMASRAPVFVAYGNHDPKDSLYQFKHLKTVHPVHVVDKADVVTVLTPQGRYLSAFVLPYPYPSGLVADGVAPGDVIPAARTMLDAIFMDAAMRLEACRSKGHAVLFLGHANIGGSLASTGQPMIGREIELDAALFARLGSCPLILNHIHKPQVVDGAWFAGSVTAMSWGETEAKRYLTVEYSRHDGAWFWNVQSHPLDTPALYLVDATFEMTDADGLFAPVLSYSTPPDEVPAQSDVRVRVRFQSLNREYVQAARARAKSHFAHSRSCAVEFISEADRGLRAPEVATATTVPEKVVAWAKHTGVAAPAEFEVALARLMSGTPREIVTAFQERILALEKSDDHNPA